VRAKPRRRDRGGLGRRRGRTRLSPAWTRRPDGDDRWGPPVGLSGGGGESRAGWQAAGPTGPKARDAADWAAACAGCCWATAGLDAALG
jgi:hypothetical protein